MVAAMQRSDPLASGGLSRLAMSMPAPVPRAVCPPPTSVCTSSILCHPYDTGNWNFLCLVGLGAVPW